MNFHSVASRINQRTYPACIICHSIHFIGNSWRDRWRDAWHTQRENLLL